MATVFQRRGSPVWTAKFRAWDAARGDWRWLSRSTGCEDRGQAVRVAAGFESAAQMAAAGRIDRAKVRDVVNDILRLAGLDTAEAAPSLAELAEDWLRSRERATADGTLRKYRAHWTRLERWAGDRARQPVDGWQARELQRYYDDLLVTYSATTANDHWATVRRLFARAMRAGHVQADPTGLVDVSGSDSLRKEPLRRGEVAAVLRAMRRAGRRDWVALTLLGWHTGHRLADLLAVTPANLGHAEGIGPTLTLRPAKKRGRGGRDVVLPIPIYLASMLRRLNGFGSVGPENRNGRVSARFVGWLETAGVDPMPIQRGPRRLNLKSFHSLRHAMASRLTAAGVSGELARLVTDHDSPQVARGYVHAEVAALAEALRRARRR